MNRSIIAILLILLLLPLAQARVDYGSDQLVVYEISSESGIKQAFAIVLPKALYKSGETIESTIGSSVPCNTKYVHLTIDKSDGTQLYYKDVSSLFTPCSTSYVKITFSAPATAGNYKINVNFKDGNNQALYTDSTVFAVGTASCPAGYCTDWQSTQKFEYGQLQQKTCYTYDQNQQCKQTQSQFYRTVCDSGFELKNNVCVKPNNEATCGDRVVQSGEECDAGDDNGVCPSICNNMCRKSNCQELPDEQPAEKADEKENDEGNMKTGAIIFFVAFFIIGITGLAALGMWLAKKR